MFFYPGVALLWAAFAFGLAATWGWIQVMRGDEGALPYARRTYLLLVAAVVGASALLMNRLLVHDYRIGYVASYSDSGLPLHYLISTFWAGQEGSFLLWLFCGALIGIPLYRSAKEQEAPTMIVYVATLLALLAILMRQSPFKFLSPEEVPLDGRGLNPLLQNPWMTIHPPVMFVGFASLGVPFAFAIAGLWKRRYESWIVRSLPWVLVSFVTLGTAILMGGYWAYITLGWGGYWGWDPVENTSLVPWIGVTALLHGMYAQRKKGRYRRLNFSLAILSFVGILYGTFLTRSGVLADFSVHSFVDLGITGWLVAYLATFLVGGFAVLAWRWREIPSEDASEPFLSKGVFLLLSIASLCASGFVILLGTSAPLLTRLSENPSQVATRFYNVTNSPVALLLVLLMGFLPVVDWKGTTGREALRRSVGPLIFAAVAGAVTVALGVRNPLWAAICTAAWFAFAANVSRYSKTAAAGAFTKGAGYLAHAGMAVMIGGIVLSSAFDRSEKATLERGQPTEANGLRLTFQQIVRTADRKNGFEVKVEDPRRGDARLVYPKLYENEKTKQLMANPDVWNKPFWDVYVSPQEYDPGRPAGGAAEFELAKGESESIGDLSITFVDFDIDFEKMMDDSANAEIGVRLEVSRDGKTVPLALSWAVREGGGAKSVAPLPMGPDGARVSLTGMNAEAGAIRFAVEGPEGFAPAIPAKPETFAIDVTIKPMMNLVWGGFYILMAGGLLALVGRFRASLAAASLPPDPDPVALPPATESAPETPDTPATAEA